MARGHYSRRFDSLQRDRVVSLAGHPGGFSRGQGSRASHELRVGRALALSQAAGISLDDAYPLALRNLHVLGWRPRPVHFLPLWVPFLIGQGFGVILAVMVLGAAAVLGGEVGPLALVTNLGWSGVLAVSAVFGAMFAASIRLRARRARLPRWSDI